MKIFKIICALIFAFLFCLCSSIYFKYTFDIEGDYLSAFSTLVAAIAAYYFYSDWKVEHKFKLLEQHHSLLKDKSSKILTYFRVAQVLFLNTNDLTLESSDGKLVEGTVELNLFFVELSNVLKMLLEYRSCLSNLESDKVLENHKLKLNKYYERISEIHDEYLAKMPLYPHDKHSYDYCIVVLESWRESIIKFDFFCSVELSEFYFKYLKTK